MIILIDTSKAICKIVFIDNSHEQRYEWDAGRGLAKDLLGFILNKLNENSKEWGDIQAIGVFEGPGSFTGIRIGMTVMNIIADSQRIQIVGARGDNWESVAIEKIKSGVNEKVVLPFYGSDANITAQRK